MSGATADLGALVGGDGLSLEAALRACGWQRRDATRHHLPTEQGEALLREVGGRDQWRQFQLHGGALCQTTSQRLLWDNAGLFGPAKWIAMPGAAPICRLDVPDDLAGSTAGLLDFDSGSLDPRAAWARAVSTAATGQSPPSPAAGLSEEAAAEEIDRAGWPASIDEGRLHVNVQTRGTYRQLELERDPVSGVKLVAGLVDLDPLARPCLEAILHFAQVANARLPLVRLAIHQRGAHRTLLAEVGFGAALVGGAWLLAALYVLETAVARCAAEVEALRDPELARLLLAAHAAGKSLTIS